MAANRTTSNKRPLGRAQFVVQADHETLAVHLDRQGFRRLLQTLEQLAETGDRQDFEQSGRQQQGLGDAAPQDVSVGKLTFHIDDASGH